MKNLFAAVRAFASMHYGVRPTEITIVFEDGEQCRLSVPPVVAVAELPPFVPTPFQSDILAALEGKALRTDALANKVGDRSRLYRRPGGIHELRDNGLVAHHPRLGYFRPDCPPAELSQFVHQSG
jgi:hypothetical protein